MSTLAIVIAIISLYNGFFIVRNHTPNDVRAANIAAAIMQAAALNIAFWSWLVAR